MNIIISTEGKVFDPQKVYQIDNIISYLKVVGLPLKYRKEVKRRVIEAMKEAFIFGSTQMHEKATATEIHKNTDIECRKCGCHFVTCADEFAKIIKCPKGCTTITKPCEDQHD